MPGAEKMTVTARVTWVVKEDADRGRFRCLCKRSTDEDGHPYGQFSSQVWVVGQVVESNVSFVTIESLDPQPMQSGERIEMFSGPHKIADAVVIRCLEVRSA